MIESPKAITSNGYFYDLKILFKNGTYIFVEAEWDQDLTPLQYARVLCSTNFHAFMKPDGSCTLVNMDNVTAIEIKTKKDEDEDDDD